MTTRSLLLILLVEFALSSRVADKVRRSLKRFCLDDFQARSRFIPCHGERPTSLVNVRSSLISFYQSIRLGA